LNLPLRGLLIFFFKFLIFILEHCLFCVC